MRRILVVSALLTSASAWAQPSATPPLGQPAPPVAQPAPSPPAATPPALPVAPPSTDGQPPLLDEQPPPYPPPYSPPYPPPPSGPPFAVSPEPARPADPGLDAGLLEDANATSAMFMPTALTPPAGTFGFHSYELFFIGGSVSITDRLQLSTTALIPLVADQGFNGIISGKYQVVRNDRLRVALHATTAVLSSDADFTSGLIGGVATMCLNADCTTHASGYGAFGLAAGDQSTYPFTFAGSAVVRMARRIRFIVEIDSALLTGAINEVSDAFLLWYGLRFASPNISADFGFVKPMSTDGEWTSDFLPMGFPIVSFTFRSD